MSEVIETKIDGLLIKKLKVIPDERGFLMEGIRSDDHFFKEFGQMYISGIYPDVVKGWHYHKEQTDHVICVSGMIKLVVVDTRDIGAVEEDGITEICRISHNQKKLEDEREDRIQEFFIGDRNPCCVIIPKGCYHGWKGIEGNPALVANCPDKVYNYKQPDEFRLDSHTCSIPYTWGRSDG